MKPKRGSDELEAFLGRSRAPSDCLELTKEKINPRWGGGKLDDSMKGAVLCILDNRFKITLPASVEEEQLG